MFLAFTVASGSGFSSKNLGLRIQKKVLGKFSTKSVAKSFIDDELGQMLDIVHEILSREIGNTKAEKVVKNMIKMTVKVGILYKNSQFNDEELIIGVQLRKKLRNAALTVISFYEVDFSYDHAYLVKLIAEIGELLHKLVDRHLTPKSHQRIDNVIEIFSNRELLDKVFVTGEPYHDKLPQISSAFDKVVDAEW